MPRQLSMTLSEMRRVYVGAQRLLGNCVGRVIGLRNLRSLPACTEGAMLRMRELETPGWSKKARSEARLVACTPARWGTVPPIRHRFGSD